MRFFSLIQNPLTADPLSTPMLEEARVDERGYPQDDTFKQLTTIHPWHFYYRQIMQTGIPMALSYTFSLELVAIGLISLRMDNRSKNAAATILSQTIMSMTACQSNPWGRNGLLGRLMLNPF